MGSRGLWLQIGLLAGAVVVVAELGPVLPQSLHHIVVAVLAVRALRDGFGAGRRAIFGCVRPSLAQQALWGTVLALRVVADTSGLDGLPDLDPRRPRDPAAPTCRCES
jgi:hypothetical protein